MSDKSYNGSNMKVFFSVFIATQVVCGVVGYLLFPDTYKSFFKKFNDLVTIGQVQYNEPYVSKNVDNYSSSNTLDHLVSSSANTNKSTGSNINFYKILQDMTQEEYSTYTNTIRDLLNESPTTNNQNQ
jgi:hypothetical protein